MSVREVVPVGLHNTLERLLTRIGSTVWLDPAAAEAVARAILSAVEGWRVDQAVTAWAEPCNGGGAR